MIITREYLRANPNHVFVFGDNLLRKGKGGAAELRDEPNAYGFITKKYPNNEDASFYRPDDYRPMFHREMSTLYEFVGKHPEKTFLITPLGAGLADRYKIWEQVIRPGLEYIRAFPNVVFLWEV